MNTHEIILLIALVVLFCTILFYASGGEIAITTAKYKIVRSWSDPWHRYMVAIRHGPIWWYLNTGETTIIWEERRMYDTIGEARAAMMEYFNQVPPPEIKCGVIEYGELPKKRDE